MLDNESPVSDEDLVKLRQWCLEHALRVFQHERRSYNGDLDWRVQSARILEEYLLEDCLEPEEDDEPKTAPHNLGTKLEERHHVPGLEPVQVPKA